MENHLYAFFSSGTSYRLRLALNLKGLDYTYHPVNLRAGEHRSEAYRRVNPQGLVPAFQVGDGPVIAQSSAIIEFLEEQWPEPALFPSDAQERARARAMAAMIACDIHPLNSLRVMSTLRNTFGADEDAIKEWARTWIGAGFDALEALLPEDAGKGRFAFGASPGVVEVYLIPQVAGARRYGVDMGAYPKINALDLACNALPAFQTAHPDTEPVTK